MCIPASAFFFWGKVIYTKKEERKKPEIYETLISSTYMNFHFTRREPQKGRRKVLEVA